MKYNSFLFNLKKYGILYGALKILKKLRFIKEDYSALCVQRYYRNLPEDKRENELSCWFNNAVGYMPNLKTPSTFDEKLQWCKLHNSTKTKSELADKVRVKDWVTNRIGSEYVIPTIGVYDSFEDIDFSTLPSKFVLKASHGSRMNIIVENKNDLVMKEIKRKLDYWMKYYYGIDGEQEWHYLSIPHKIIAEAFVESSGGVE